MSLYIRIRPEFEPRLRPVTNSFVREFKKEPSSLDEEPDIGPGLSVSSLPVMATANDARELVRFLKKRPNGVTTVEAMNAEPRRIFDARKIAAYEFWGIIHRDNDRLTLTRLGEELADALEPECSLHRSILHRVPAYQTAIKCIFEEGLDIATHLDVLRHWSGSRSAAAAFRGNAQDLEAAVVCFFSLCHAAELGTSTVGKRGQPARLRVEMDQVAIFLSEVPELAGAVVSPPRQRDAPKAARFVGTREIRTVLVSSSNSEESTGQLDALLSLAGFESSVVYHSGLENGLLPGSELNEMQRCQAGIFVIGPNDCEKRKDGIFSLRAEWITKISVAAALFDWRVVLFWSGELPPPEELTASGVKLLSGPSLDWGSGLEIVNQIKELALPLTE